MAYALSLSGLLTTFRHHFVQRPHAQCKFNCFNPTARACYVTFGCGIEQRCISSADVQNGEYLLITSGENRYNSRMAIGWKAA